MGCHLQNPVPSLQITSCCFWLRQIFLLFFSFFFSFLQKPQGSESEQEEEEDGDKAGEDGEQNEEGDRMSSTSGKAVTLEMVKKWVAKVTKVSHM